MRVLMATPRFHPDMGGVENHVREVSKRLVGRGADVTVVTTDVSQRYPSQEFVDGVEVLRAPAGPRGKDWLFSPQLYHIIRDGHWDLVHVQSYHTCVAPIAMLGALRSRRPYVLTFHGGGHSSVLRNRARPLQWRALRPLVRRADRLVALAKFEVELYGRAFGLRPEAFAVIPNGSDFPEGPANNPVETEHDLVVSIGRLEKYKGHHRVIGALPDLLSVRPHARVLILGSGPYESTLRDVSERLGVADRVEIRAIPPADRKAMAHAIARAAIVVLMSQYETHPLAALEALALRRSLLVAATSGLTEVARAGNGRTIALECSDRELAAAIADQLDHPAVPRAVTLPTWDDCADRIQALYLDILEARQGGVTA